jgi:hypothetical protein
MGPGSGDPSVIGPVTGLETSLVLPAVGVRTDVQEELWSSCMGGVEGLSQGCICTFIQ